MHFEVVQLRKGAEQLKKPLNRFVHLFGRLPSLGRIREHGILNRSVYRNGMQEPSDVELPTGGHTTLRHEPQEHLQDKASEFAWP